MQLEIGKRYVTRSGLKTTHVTHNVSSGTHYPFLAHLEKQGSRNFGWTPAGRFNLSTEHHPWDLVAEYHEPEIPALKDVEEVTAMAEAMRRPIEMLPPGTDIRHEPEDILMEALRLTSGDRQQQYGPPEKNLGTIAALWAAYKGVSFEARDVAAMMILVKVAREIAGPKRDTAVDIAGYARLMHLCNEAAAKQPAQ